MNKLVKNIEAGFTLTELIVVMVVGTLVATVVLSVNLFFFADIMKSSLETQLTLEAQNINNVVVEDLRLAESILDTVDTVNLNDPSEPAGGWNTSDPDHILIVSELAVDENGEFILDDENGVLFKNNLIYFAEDQILYKRILTNPLAVDNIALQTCPESLATVSCPADKVISENFNDMTFNFFDLNGDSTTVVPDARSINIIIDVERSAYGRSASAKNDIRVTLRNPT